jgi:hypothetical protein
MKETLRWYREWIYGLLLMIGRRAHTLLLGPDYTATGKRPAMKGIIKKCAYCKEFVKFEAWACVFCGAIL